MQYTKLRIVDDWGKLSIERPGALPETWIPVAFGEGQLVGVRWPDGFCEQLHVVHKKKTRSVYDCGHEYEVSNNMPGVISMMNGLPMWVGLHEIEVLV